jgi:hypothetical protein
MSNRIFHDLELESHFQKNGFVSIPLLSPEEVSEINDELTHLATDAQLRERMPFYLSLFDGDQAHKKLCRQVISRVASRFQTVLFNYRFTLGNLFYKFPDSGELNIHDHADQTDESKYTSITVWIPLVDTDRTNGTLELVDGSHKLFPFITHFNAPLYFNDFSRSLVDNYCRPTNARAGEAIIFCDKLIHYSGPNFTDSTRRAIQIRFIPNEAPFLYYHLDTAEPEKGFEVYECSEAYFEEQACSVAMFQMRPQGLKLVDVIPNRNRNISEAEFRQSLASGDAIRAQFYKSSLQ